MIFERGPTNGDGQWHCPFPREWVERMARAAKYCGTLTAEQVEAAYIRIDSGAYYAVPPGDFLDGPQDARGLPVGYGDGLGRNVRCAIYDYDSIPEMVISNGHDDWPLRMCEQVLTA